MTAGQQTCALSGCNKSPPLLSPGRASPHHLACGNLHHLLLMAGRFNPNLPHPHQPILDRNAAGLCALPACYEPPHPRHSWCSRTHYLHWLSDFMSSLLQDQICKLFPACTRHVFVEEDGSSSQFCSWRHCQKYVMLSAVRCRQELPDPQQSLPSPLSFIEVDSEGQTSMLIVRCKYTSKGKRILVTKDNYHWKQQGRPVSKCDFTLKYFTYTELKGKQNDVGKHGNGCAYHMEEYTTEDVKEFSLVKLRKVIGGLGRHCKGRPAAGVKRSGADITDSCSQNKLLSKSDGMSADSFFWELSTLVDCPYDFDQVFSSSWESEDY